MKKKNEWGKEGTNAHTNERTNNRWIEMYLAGVDLQFSVSEQCFVAAVATAALNASCKGWFH